MISKENKIDDLVNSKSLGNTATNETIKSQNEMEEELKIEYIDILKNFYFHSCELYPECKASIFKTSICDLTTMCFSKVDFLYIGSEKVTWCFENCIKEHFAYKYLKKALIRVEDKILEENKFDKDDVYLYFKDFYVFQLAYNEVCESFKLNEYTPSVKISSRKI